MVMATNTPKGYKKTEVGIIPEDWVVKRLGDIFRVTRGQVLAMRKITSDSIGEYRYPVYSSQTKEDGLAGYYTDYLFEDCITWTTDGAKAGDVKFRAGKFYCTNVCGVLESKEGYSNQCIAAIFNSISRKYVSYVGNPKLMNNVVADIKIGIPKQIKEQTAVATALSDTDMLIAVTEKLIAKKRNIKQGVMQELLTGKKHLSGFSEKWETRLMGKLGKTYGGLSGKSKDDFQNGGYPYIPFLNILNNPVIDAQYFDYVNVKPEENQNRAQKGDLFFNGSSETPEEVGMCSVLLNDVPNLYLNSFCFGVRLNNEIKASGLYLSYFFRSDVGRQLVFFLAQGATRHNLSKTSFMKLEIPYPSYEEQVAIAQVLSDMDAEIERLENKLAKYRMVKQGMMQELLTGKTRVI